MTFLLLILGGITPFAVYASGESWQATTTTGAPEGRAAHSAVWTGSEMIVWGGEIGLGGPTVSTGYRYNPTTDAWASISNVNAPSPRQFHTAIWIGNEMIVWGGEAGDSGPTLNTGSRYNPVTDTWIPMSTLGAPTGRYLHAAVWTGVSCWCGVAIPSPPAWFRPIPEAAIPSQRHLAGYVDSRSAERAHGCQQCVDWIGDDCVGRSDRLPVRMQRP